MREICLLKGDPLPEVFFAHLIVHCEQMHSLGDNDRKVDILGCRVYLHTIFAVNTSPDGKMVGTQFLATVRDAYQRPFTWTFIVTGFLQNETGRAIWEPLNHAITDTTRRHMLSN